MSRRGRGWLEWVFDPIGVVTFCWFDGGRRRDTYTPTPMVRGWDGGGVVDFYFMWSSGWGYESPCILGGSLSISLFIMNYL